MSNIDYSIIYQNQNVYIIHIDSVSTKYDKEIYGTLTLKEHRKQVGINSLVERFIIWKPHEKDLPKGVRMIKIDIANLKSIKRAKMTMGNGCSYMIFYEKEGSHYPMLVFPDGGTKNLMDKLENYIAVARSTSDKNLYLIQSRKESNALDTFDTFSSLGAVLNDIPTHVPRKNQGSVPLWSGLINIGANISNQFQRNHIFEDNKLRNLLREDAIGVEVNELKLESKQDTDLGFTVITKPIRLNLPPASPFPRKEPLSEAEWNKHLAPDGSVTCVDKLLEKIFKGGIDDSIRKVVWKYLLGYYDWNSSLEDNLKMVEEKKKLYYKLEVQWQNVFPEQEERFSLFQDRKSIIERDVHRTDRNLDFYSSENGNLDSIRNILMAYSMFNFNLGYVQGMNDILAPVLYVMNDEIDSFWCFAKLMDIMENNFNFEQNGIKNQFIQLFTLVQIFDPEFANYLENKGCHDLLFCFRFLLVNFKRELSYENTMYLWEVLWTNYRCKNFKLLFALAVLLSQRNHIIENRYGLNEILKHINDLVLNGDLRDLLSRAESLYLQLEQVWPQIPSEVKHILDFNLIANTNNCNTAVNSNTNRHTTSLSTSSTHSSVDCVRPGRVPDNFSSDFIVDSP